MSDQRDQLFSKDTFNTYMSDEEYSVGSAHGSIGGHSRLGGLAGLRPVNSPDKSTEGLRSSSASPSKPSSHASPVKHLGGLGGLRGGGLGGLRGEESGGEVPRSGGLGGLRGGGLGGLRGEESGGGAPRSGGLGGLRSGGLGGLRDVEAPRLGGLGGLRGGEASRVRGGESGGGLGGLKSKQAGLGGLGGARLAGATTFSAPTVQMGNMKLEGASEIVDVLKTILSNLQGLSERTIIGFRDVANRINKDESDADLTDCKNALETLVEKIDEAIASKNDEVYIVIPGHDNKTLTEDEATILLKGKSVRVFGTIGGIATVTRNTM